MKVLNRPPQSGGRGILWMILSCVFLASVNVFAKTLTSDYAIPQVLWARYVFHLMILVLIFGSGILHTLKTDHFGMQASRSGLMIIAAACYFTGISMIALADASAIMFIVPIIVTAVSAPFLGERIGLRRWLGVLCGLLGALIIIRPGTGMMQTGALFMIGASISQAFYQILTRRVSDTDSPSTSLIYAALGGGIVLSAIVPFYWIQPDLKSWIFMILLGLCAGAGHFAMIKAYTAAPAPTVAPYFYTHLIWSTIFGYSFFGDLPDLWTLTGAGVIVTSGLYIYHREKLRKQEVV
ncbi:MAG: DMT family transporter [Rhodospirillales bacterium]|jgi:drug/metabolite transporter (DMT)-like permease